MELSLDEQELLTEMENEGGKRWEQFRARRNQWVRKGKSEEWATWRSLQNAKQSNVIPISSRDVAALTPQDWTLIYLSGIIWIVLTIYQVGIHAESFGNGFHGYFVAIALEVVLAFMAFVKIDNPHKQVARWLGVLAVMGFLVMSIYNTTKLQAIQRDPEYQRELANHNRLQTNYDDTNENATKARRNVIEMISESSRKLSEIERKHTGIGFGTGISDLNLQVRIVFMVAQVAASHVLGLAILSKK